MRSQKTAQRNRLFSKAMMTTMLPQTQQEHHQELPAQAKPKEKKRGKAKTDQKEHPQDPAQAKPKEKKKVKMGQAQAKARPKAKMGQAQAKARPKEKMGQKEQMRSQKTDQRNRLFSKAMMTTMLPQTQQEHHQELPAQAKPKEKKKLKMGQAQAKA